MPQDSTSIEMSEGVFVTTFDSQYRYDSFGYAWVKFPIYDIYGRLSRYEDRHMHRNEIEKYNREHPDD